MRRRFTDSDTSLCCSFCHKVQGAVGKLISSPSDYPQAHICDECIAVCNAIIEDDRPEEDEAESSVTDSEQQPHPLLTHPLASRFFTSVENWVRQESLGADAAEDLAEMRSIASRMLQESVK